MSDDTLDFQEFLEQTKPKHKIRINGHLNQPITDDDITFLLNNNRFFCKRHKSVKDYITKSGITESIYTVCPSPWYCILNQIRGLNKNSQNGRSKLRVQLKRVFEASINIFLFHKTAYNNKELFYTNETLKTRIYSELINDEILVEWYCWQFNSEEIKNQFNSNFVELGEFIHIANLDIEREVFCFNCKDHGKSLGPTSLLLGCLDILQTRFPLLLYWTLSDLFHKYPSSIRKRGLDLIHYFENLYIPLGEDIFQLLKCWESYIIGNICSDSINDVGFKDLLDATEKSITKIYPHFHQTMLPKLLMGDLENEIDIRMSLELCVLNKNFGHPCIDPFSGIAEIKELATRYTKINHDRVRYVRSMFVRMIMKNYRMQKRKYPNYSYRYRPSPILHNILTMNRLPSPTEELAIHTLDWDCIKFNKNDEYDMSEDTTELLSDKSCAPQLKNWTQKYDNCGFVIHHSQNKPFITPDETRVVIRYLKGSPDELKEVIEEQCTGNLDYQNNISILCRKEREMKKKGRLFCEQTYRQRLLQTSMESNIKKTIYKYFHYQTMSDSELRLKKKITSFLRIQSDDDCEIINLDLHRWNMLQRHESNSLICQDLDDWFGIKNIFTDSHLWMQRCYVLNNSRVNPPRIDKNGLPKPGMSCHINQFGGFEGMRQKVWTIPTICAIYLAAEVCNVKVNVIGQGDNQVILIKWSPSQVPEKLKLRKELINTIETVFKDIGLILKKEETWISSRLMEYGKSRYLYGAAISNGTKRAMRIIPDEHDGIPTFDTSICIISTSTENIAMSDWSPDPAYMLYLVLLITYFYRKSIFSVTTSVLSIQSILFFPCIFGGLPLSTYFNHNVRGFDDQLTVWISLLMILRLLDKELFSIVVRVIPFNKRKRVNYEGLIKDIYSLNIISLKTASLTAADYVKNILPSVATNPEVLRILNISVSGRDELIANLTSINPFFGPLVHELYRNSILGTILNLQNRLTNIQSIIKLAISTSGVDIAGKILETDNKLIYHLKKTFDIDPTKVIKNKSANSELLSMINYSNCSLQCAKKIRENHWGLDIEGVSSPVPWEQIRLRSMEGLISSSIKQTQNKIPDHMAITTSTIFRTSEQEYKTKLGPYPPYFGSLTHVKISKSSVTSITNTPFSNSIKQLYYMKSWAQKTASKDLCDFIDNLIKEKLDLFDIENIGEFKEEDQPTIYGGHILHRFKSIQESKGALINMLPTIASHVKTSTTPLSSMMKGGEDFNLFFQLFFLYIQTRLSDLRNRNPTSIPLDPLCATLSCKECTVLYKDIKFSMEKKGIQLQTTINCNCKKEKCDCLNLSYCKVDEDITPLRLIISLSFYLGEKLGERVDYDRNTHLAEKEFLGESFSIEGAQEISMTEFRHINFEYLLIGMILSSFNIRNYLLNTDLNEAIRIRTYLGQQLVSLCMICSRLHELYVYMGITPSDFSESNIPSVAGKLVISNLYKLFSRKNNNLLLTLTQIIHNNELLLSNKSIVIWICRLIIKVLQNSFVKDEGNRKYLAAILRTLSGVRFNPVREFRSLSIMLVTAVKCITDINSKDLNLISNEATLYWFRSWYLRQPDLHTKGKEREFKLETDSVSHQAKISNLSNVIITNIRADVRVVDSSYVEELNIELLRCIRTLSTPIFELNDNPSAILVILCHIGLLSYDKLMDTQFCVCLAEGSGAILSLLLHLYPNAFGSFNTLMAPEINPTIEIDNYLPPALVGETCFNPYDRLSGTQFLINGDTDITTSTFVEKFKTLAFFSLIDILTIDLESLDEHVYCKLLSHITVYIRSLKIGGYIIFKMLCSRRCLEKIDRIFKDLVLLIMKPSPDHQLSKYTYFIYKAGEDYTDHELEFTYRKMDIFYYEETLICTDLEVAIIDSTHLLCIDYELTYKNYLKTGAYLRTYLYSFDKCESLNFFRNKHCDHFLRILSTTLDLTWEHINRSSIEAATTLLKGSRYSKIEAGLVTSLICSFIIYYPEHPTDEQIYHFRLLLNYQLIIQGISIDYDKGTIEGINYILAQVQEKGCCIFNKYKKQILSTLRCVQQLRYGCSIYKDECSHLTLEYLVSNITHGNYRKAKIMRKIITDIKYRLYTNRLSSVI